MTLPTSVPRRDHDTRPRYPPRLPNVAPTKFFRWRTRLRRDSTIHIAGILTGTLLLAAVPIIHLARPESLSALAMAVPISLLGLRATFLFPHESERLDRTSEAMRRAEETAYVAKYWNSTRNREAVKTFLAAFDSSQFTLSDNIVARMGLFGAAMPLHQQLSYAVEARIWTADDADLWMKCLMVQQEVLLSQHSRFTAAGLNTLSQRLGRLTQRTLSSAA